MLVRRYDRSALEKAGGGRDSRSESTVGRRGCWARVLVGEKRVRSAKGKSTWDVFSRTVGKGVQKGYAVEARVWGWEEVAMFSHVGTDGHEDEAPLWTEGRQQG